ncbi:hypothetical protein AAFF_G00432470 [Aldrovandia affinis]|uniref:Uncharacterized protein n=1 Tax=Aldrovandia affinis TaxID=143900 RepID=A0AAD7S8G2_9TELE|nr:hypothetical protein AAFF_G00432470 [Aldrovandia affinis]
MCGDGGGYTQKGGDDGLPFAGTADNLRRPRRDGLWIVSSSRRPVTGVSQRDTRPGPAEERQTAGEPTEARKSRASDWGSKAITIRAPMVCRGSPSPLRLNLNAPQSVCVQSNGPIDTARQSLVPPPPPYPPPVPDLRSLVGTVTAGVSVGGEGNKLAETQEPISGFSYRKICPFTLWRAPGPADGKRQG